MKKTRLIVSFLVIGCVFFTIIPASISQVGTYTFHGAAGNEKILKVRTVNDQALEDLFGTGWKTILEDAFGEGCTEVGARFKAIVVSVNISDKKDLTAYGLGVADMTSYVTTTWNWTTATFSNSPDIINVTVESFYDPELLTDYIQLFWYYYFLSLNLTVQVDVSVQNAALYFLQLPTSVDSYLGEIEWEDKWVNSGNTIVHNAEAGDFSFLNIFQYLEDCTETWTFDTTYGAYIGYKIQDDTDTTIYQYSLELPSGAEIPGFSIPILISISIGFMIGLIYIMKRKK